MRNAGQDHALACVMRDQIHDGLRLTRLVWRPVLAQIEGVQTVFITFQTQHPHQRQGAAAPVRGVSGIGVLQAVFGLAVFPFGCGHHLGDARQRHRVKVFPLFHQQKLACATVFPVEVDDGVPGSGTAGKEVEGDGLLVVGAGHIHAVLHSVG